MVIPVIDENFDEAVKSSHTVIVDCWAPWCSPCVKLGPVIEAFSSEFPDITFVSINTDTERETAAKLGIMALPVILKYVDGELVSKLQGTVTKSAIRKLLENV